MDKLPHDLTYSTAEAPLRDSSFSMKDLAELGLGFVRRQYPIMILIVACAVALSAVYLLTVPKLYTAHAMFLIDTSKMQILQQQQQVIGELPLDTAQVETQIELLKSEGIGLSVVKDLKLTEDPEFVGRRSGIAGALLGLISVQVPSEAASPEGLLSEDVLTRRALGRLQGNREIKRVARTYVLDISYTSLNSGRAAQVANAIGEAYLTDQLSAKFQASRRASRWLQDRIAELRDEAMAADRAVLVFKEQKNIVDVGGPAAGGGRLLADQGVLDVNSDLARARADVAEAKARLDRIEVIKAGDIPDAAVADSLNNSIIGTLRTQYLDYDRRARIFEQRYGTAHLAVVSLRTQMAQLRRSMADELTRIAESYKSNYEIAKSRAESLEKSLDQQIVGAQLTNRERLGLDELESRAKAYHSIHDSFLQRYMEVSQQQSLPITEARIITAARPPGIASSPQTSKVLMMASLLGFAFAFGVASLREAVDRVFRTSKQVEQLLKTNCLAALPVVKASAASGPTRSGNSSSQNEAGLPGAHPISLAPSGLFRYIIHEPLSGFAEGIRAVKVAADISGTIKKNQVLGVTSSLPNEGKSTVAANLAELIAHGGRRAILIDADLRNPTLSRKWVTKPETGLLQVLAGEVELRDAVFADPESGLDFLPAVIESRLAHSSEIVGSERFRQVIESLREIYDYIVIDFPPLAPVVDVRATTQVVDSYVYVIEWGRTRINMVQRQLAAAPEIFDRLLGIVLNKANVNVLNRYEDYYGYYYKKQYYARYGYSG